MACITCCHICTSMLPGSTQPSLASLAAPARAPAYTACSCRISTNTAAATTQSRLNVSLTRSLSSSMVASPIPEKYHNFPIMRKSLK
ncbi:hypothetical protein PanWU01x14_318230 [Parasponia andersonii]|uniref:Uncharacterized protein n=1 Tax=Parasponia andersonii TaxID=3476 RepID=A0A2P5AM90_PARAD|nr:hypothetical protein PanWU01x14_318230 [Parasponia andersonii]